MAPRNICVNQLNHTYPSAQMKTDTSGYSEKNQDVKVGEYDRVRGDMWLSCGLGFMWVLPLFGHDTRVSEPRIGHGKVTCRCRYKLRLQLQA